ncbi:DoxX family protein [Metallibacterium sp.]|uniref:DoxX family protein n=1 Tax=Metallibacterium sp. TaxID=2940281 RepID=UPI00263371DC|nr:DoxX family protein [Metallibacterium sp.]
MIKTSTAPYAALLLRVSLGVLFLAHVALKIFVFTVPGFVAYFATLGLPAIAAYAIIALEFFGGVALILGVYAPWVALPLALEMLGTIVMVHGANGWLFTNKGGGWEYPAFWAVSLVVLFLLGDGVLALKPVGRTIR